MLVVMVTVAVTVAVTVRQIVLTVAGMEVLTAVLGEAVCLVYYILFILVVLGIELRAC